LPTIFIFVYLLTRSLSEERVPDVGRFENTVRNELFDK